MKGRAYHYPRRLDAERMNEAAQYLVGEHDFSSFMASGSKIEDAVRKIYFCSVIRDGDKITVSICGNGFLYNMVRIIVGTLIEVSEGRIEPHEIKTIIEQRDRRLSGPTAPPEGLYLYNVEYL
jgi:tRNA pseudouridine38-40 synthase